MCPDGGSLEWREAFSLGAVDLEWWMLLEFDLYDSCGSRCNPGRSLLVWTMVGMSLVMSRESSRGCRGAEGLTLVDIWGVSRGSSSRDIRGNDTS